MRSRVRQMLASVRDRLRHAFAWLFRWTASAKDVPAIKQTAWQRAKVDTSSFAAGRPILFGTFATAGVATVGIVAATLASGHSVAVQVVCGVVGAVGGFLLIVIVIVGICWLLAFPRQRNEARTEVRTLDPAAGDGAALAREFSAWVLTRRESIPRAGGFRLMTGVFPQQGMSSDTHYGLLRDQEKRADAVAAVEAETRSQYHERFRDPMTGILGDTAAVREPQTAADLEKLSVQLARATGTTPPPKVVLRALSREGHKLRNEMPADMSVEQRRAFEPRVDEYKARAVEALTECAPEFVSELESVPAYHPADLAAIPYYGDPAPLDGYLDGLLKFIDRAVKAA
jgi:hypothetical protein